MCILCVLDLPILGLQYAQMRVPMHRAWPCIVHGVRCSGGPVRATQHAAMQAARSARARLTVGARVCRPAQGQWRLLLLSSVASLSSPPQSGQPGSLFPVEIGWSCAVRAACAMPGRWWPTSARPRRGRRPRAFVACVVTHLLPISRPLGVGPAPKITRAALKATVDRGAGVCVSSRWGRCTLHARGDQWTMRRRCQMCRQC